MNREKAWQIVCEFTQSDYLRRHALATATCMSYYANLHNAEQEPWYVTGLLHDFDYELHPDELSHPQNGTPLLRERGVPEDIIYSILSHGDHLQHLHPRRSWRDKSLAVVDQLSGLVIAVALVRPTKSIFDVDVAAVKKKWKDKHFAKTVIRAEVSRYVAEYGSTLDQHIEWILTALREAADDLHLRGSALQ
jgi:putative nucleotidyltransferase with HDIG domain